MRTRVPARKGQHRGLVRDLRPREEREGTRVDRERTDGGDRRDRGDPRRDPARRRDRGLPPEDGGSDGRGRGCWRGRSTGRHGAARRDRLPQEPWADPRRETGPAGEDVPGRMVGNLRIRGGTRTPALAGPPRDLRGDRDRGGPSHRPGSRDPDPPRVHGVRDPPVPLRREGSGGVLDWENVEARWVRPEAVPVLRKTVPRLADVLASVLPRPTSGGPRPGRPPARGGGAGARRGRRGSRRTGGSRRASRPGPGGPARAAAP